MSLPPPGTDELSWAGARSAVRRRVQAIVGAPMVEPTLPGRHAAVLIAPVAAHSPAEPEVLSKIAAEVGAEPDSPKAGTADAEQSTQASEPTPQPEGSSQAEGAGASSDRVVIPLGPSGIQPDAPAATEPGWGLPGWLLFVVSMSAVLFAAIAEVRATGSIAEATGATLIVCSLGSAVFTRRGDLPLAVMMPPLAFVVAVLVAGQLLVDTQPGNWKANQTLMIFDQLGGNARWVLLATALVVVIVAARSLVGWLVRRRRASQS